MALNECECVILEAPFSALKLFISGLDVRRLAVDRVAEYGLVIGTDDDVPTTFDMDEVAGGGDE